MTRRTALAGLWTLLILAGCSLPGGAIPTIELFSPDKVYHLLAFVGYGLLWRWAGASLRAVLVTGLAFALFIELWQAVLPIGRFADPFDALADAVGLGLGLWTWSAYTKAKSERREQR